MRDPLHLPPPVPHGIRGYGSLSTVFAAGGTKLRSEGTEATRHPEREREREKKRERERDGESERRITNEIKIKRRHTHTHTAETARKLTERQLSGLSGGIIILRDNLESWSLNGPPTALIATRRARGE